MSFKSFQFITRYTQLYIHNYNFTCIIYYPTICCQYLYQYSTCASNLANELVNKIYVDDHNMGCNFLVTFLGAHIISKSCYEVCTEMQSDSKRNHYLQVDVLSACCACVRVYTV